ncbi:hypothetical protein ACJW31_12G119700 [Castanea mollissima]
MRIEQQQVIEVRPSLTWGGDSHRVAAINLEESPDNSDKHDHEDSQLLWVTLIGFTFALIIQMLAANLGVSTGKHLSELCKFEYPKYVKYCLWLLAEFAVICADIPEVIGTAFALNILFHIPIWAGVLITGLSTLLFLSLQRYGVRKLEMLISVLIMVMAACFFGEMNYVKPPAAAVVKGLFVPKLSGQGAIGSAIALWGSIIVPHNLFFYSALVLSRKVPRSVSAINDACRFHLIGSGFALVVACLINIAIISVSGTICSANNMSDVIANQCNNLSLDSAPFLLKGFLELKMRLWIRNLLTRCIAIAPSLIVSIIGGAKGAAQLIIITTMVLAFELPFALIPLLKFSNSNPKMGPHKNSIYIMVISWTLGVALTSFNLYYLITAFVGWLLHNKLPKLANVFVGIIVFPLMLIYVLAILYLTFRKDTAVTFTEPITLDQPMAQNNLEQGLNNSNEGVEADHIPYSEDLVDIPLPQ